MFQEFDCNGCGKRLRIPEEYAGALTKCPHCETTQAAPAAIPKASIVELDTPGTQNPFADNLANPYRDAPVTSNPYVAPETLAVTSFDRLLSRFRLASLSDRLAAATLDWLFFIGCGIPGLVITNLTDGFAPQFADMLGGAMFLAFMLGGMILQTYLISSRGHSLGKKLLGIRIVTAEGYPPGFLYGVFLRQWLIGILLPCYPLAFLAIITDVLFIFSERRQCLHDLVASTYVVTGRPDA